jgi:hypothetical protein
MKNGVFWVVTPCGSCENWRFGGTRRLLHQGDKIGELGTPHKLRRNGISSQRTPFFIGTTLVLHYCLLQVIAPLTVCIQDWRSLKLWPFGIVPALPLPVCPEGHYCSWIARQSKVPTPPLSFAVLIYIYCCYTTRSDYEGCYRKPWNVINKLFSES